MTVSIQEFVSGDTRYVDRLNFNFAALAVAINALQIQAGGSGAGGSVALMLDALFAGQTTLIGQGSYLPAGSGSNLTVAAGSVYKEFTQTVVQSIAPVVLSFSGQPSATYYVVPDPTGAPTFGTSPTDAVYSVVWDGAAFGTITKLVPTIMNATEEDAAHVSTALAQTFATLDARLEAGESATEIVAAALAALQDEVDSLGGSTKMRKVGCTIFGTGVAGAIQIDFDGTIVGWSIIADQPGTATIEVDLARSSPVTAPPASPLIPNTTTDKISASAPIALVASPIEQSASAAASGVSSWSTSVQKWDVIQFNVTALATLKRATLYIRIQED